MHIKLTDNSGLEKHIQYLSSYKPNDLLWGIGLENETYLEFEKCKIVNFDFFFKHNDNERYSINYYNNYKPDVYQRNLTKWLDKNIYPQSNYNLPILLNSHSFSKIDIYQQHSTHGAEGNNLPNTLFNGTTLLQYMAERDPYFSQEYGKKFIFDGDTIEFVTSNFYKGNIEDSIKQLVKNKKIFINKTRQLFKEHDLFSTYGEINFCRQNHGFATMISTNCEKVAIFNNMTYHINITLPTMLDHHSKIADPELFVEQHRNAIRILQWMEPILIANYGAGDVLGSVNSKLTKGSQRCALSRYIGVGTYDSDKMPVGKILTQPFKDHPYTNIPFWWYHQFNNDCDYNPCDEIGYDINFNKHLNHGIEFRILDYFNETKLSKLLQFLVYLMDFSQIDSIPNPVYSKCWNTMTCEVMRYGSRARITPQMQETFSQLFQTNLKTPSPIKMLNLLFENLHYRFHNKGFISKCMFKKTKNVYAI